MKTITTTLNDGIFSFDVEITIEEAIAGLEECIEDAIDAGDTRTAELAKAQLIDLLAKVEDAA